MTAVSTILLVFAFCATFSITQAEDSTMAKFEKIFKTCRERHNIQLSTLENAIKNRKLPQDDSGKRFIRCIMMGVGINELKNMIRRGNNPKGNYLGLVQLPEFQEELEASSLSAVL
ncbi:Hypothetical protein NTJ_13642 [Nesidiocoris tenuis]|uniref:Uncharacterized protein n=1 Tax=Nesidiocoris tenuis TaxID=355587 RepID=A0ABN7B8Y2_9HEMI|nr:Hypothetical protein NTJ_13642 [Nesidiocoris tenuis]